MKARRDSALVAVSKASAIVAKCDGRVISFIFILFFPIKLFVKVTVKKKQLQEMKKTTVHGE